MLTRNLAAPLRLDSRRRGDLIKSALDFGWSGLGSSTRRGIIYCVLRQDTLLSQGISPPRSRNGYWQVKSWGREPCDGLAYHPGGSRNTPSRFMLKKPG